MSNLKNTPWKVEVDYDGTCEIFATDKTRERGLRWIGSAIDESTAHAIAALPETLAELEEVRKERDYHKSQHKRNANNYKRSQEKLTQAEKERDELRAFIQLFIETQRETYGNGIKTHLSMTTLSEKAQQLLTPKE